MPTTGVGNLLMPQYLMPDFDKQATTDFTAVMNLVKQAAQMQAARNRLALAQARASRGGSVKLTKEERQQAAKKATEDAVRKFVEGDTELKKNYSIVTDPTKTAREVEDALKYIRGREPAIRAQLGTDASKSYDALFGSIKTQADKQVSARNKYGITDALATGYALGKEDISGAFRQLSAIGDAEERARIGRETAAAKQAIQQRDPYMADVAKGGASNSLYDVASGVSSMATSTLPILGAGALSVPVAATAGPAVAAGLTLAGAMGYGAGLGQSAAAERIVAEPGLTEAQQAKAIDEAMPLVTGAGVLTSLPLARPVGKLVSRALSGRVAGAAAEQAASSAAGKTLGFAARNPWIASSLEAAGEGALGMGLSTVAENAAVNAALNKPLNLTENLGEAVGAGVAMGPLFGILGARAQRRAMPKPADTAQPEAPTTPTPTTPTGKPISAVKAMEQVRASLSNDEKLLSTIDNFGSIAGTGDKATLATRLVNTSSMNLEPAERAALVREMIARDDLQHVLLKTPAKEDGTYTEAFKKKLDNAVKAYADAGGTRDTMDSILSSWDSKLTKLKDIQATAFEDYLKDTKRYENFFKRQEPTASADGGTTPRVGPADGQGTESLVREPDAADSQRGGTPKANVTEPATEPAEQVVGNTPADKSGGDGRTALQSVGPAKTPKDNVTAEGTPAPAAKRQGGRNGGVTPEGDASANQVAGESAGEAVGAARNRWNDQTVSTVTTADGGSVKTSIRRRVTPRGMLSEWVLTSRVGADGTEKNGTAPRPASGPFKDIADAIQEAYKKDHNGTIPKSGDPMLQRTVEKALDEYGGVTDPAQYGADFYAVSKGDPSITELAAGLNLVDPNNPVQQNVIQTVDTNRMNADASETPVAPEEAAALNAEVAKQNAEAVDVPESQIPDTSVGEAAGDVTDPKTIHC